MISFVWSDPLPMYSGRGGTETFTVGHVRELLRRGIPARILTFGPAKADDRKLFPGIPFRSLKSLEELSSLDDTVIYLNIPHPIPTKKQSYVIFHFPPLKQHGRRIDYIKGAADSIVIANSRFLRSFYADYLGIKLTSIHVVYPFAEPVFANIKRTKAPAGITRVLYAGRLSPEKGIYTLLESIHHPIASYKPLTDDGFVFNVTTAGSQTIHGQVLKKVLQNHPWINLIEAKHSPEEMARLFADNDIVVMPSNHRYWHEAFGMVSVEAQHAGCRVIGTNDGGLPETN